MNNDQPTRSWIGYDWFKTIVAVILAALLLYGGLSGPAQTPVALAPAALPAASATSVPAPTAAPAVAPAVSPTTAPTTVATTAPTSVPPTAPVLSATSTAVSTTAPTTATATATATSESAAPTIDAPPSTIVGGPLTLTGTGTPGSTVEILVDDEPLGTTIVSADGSWAFDVVLAEGDRSIAARTLDGSASPPVSEALTLKVGAPAAGGPLAILAPREGAKLPAGPITINGTGTPGTDLEVLDSDKVIGEGTVTADGTWEIEVTPDEGEPAIGVRVKGSDDVVGKPIRITVGNAETNFCTGLELGCQAWVTRAGGFSLRMRAGAGTDQAIVAKLPIGTQMELVEGPLQANSLSWYRVRTKGDQEGWVAGENLVLQPD